LINYILKPASEKDFDLVFGIKKNALGGYITQIWGWEEDFQQKMQVEEFHSENISLIEVNDEIVGTIGINETDDSIIISRLYILDKYQSNGIGSRIIKDIIEEYKNKKEIKLSVLIVNERAKALYERLGFDIYYIKNHHYKMRYLRK